MAGDLVTKVLVLRVIAIAALLAVAILVFPALQHLREQPSPRPPSLRFSLAAPPATELGWGDDLLDAAIAPDERQIVFVATSNGVAQLWRRALENERAEPIAGTEGARLPAWKATGNVISFFASGQLRQVSLSDGSVRDLALAPSPGGASWLADGSLVFSGAARGPIKRLRNNTLDDATKLRSEDRAHVFPMAAGEAFLYTAVLEDGRRELRLITDAGERDLVTTSGHGQLVGDVLVYARENVLLGQRFDVETQQVTGRAIPLALDVGTRPSGGSLFAASPRVLISATRTSRMYQLTWVPTNGGPRVTTHDPADYWQVRLSPDERHTAVTVTTPLVGTLDIVLVPLAEGAPVQQLTRAVAADSDPVWSKDGRTIMFRSLQGGRPRLFTRPVADPDAEDRLVSTSLTNETATDWPGDRVLVQAPGDSGSSDVWTVSSTTSTREKIVASRFNETDARLSPDSRWMAYVSDESGVPDIYATPWPRGTRTRVSFAGGSRPRWSRDGRSLFFLRESQIMRADLASPSTFGTPKAVLDVSGIRDFDVSRRRDAVIALLPTGSRPTLAPSVVIDWTSVLPETQR